MEIMVCPKTSPLIFKNKPYTCTPHRYMYNICNGVLSTREAGHYHNNSYCKKKNLISSLLLSCPHVNIFRLAFVQNNINDTKFCT